MSILKAIENAVNPTKWTIGGTPVLSKTGLRDVAEAGLVDVGNYLLPGSSLLTSNLASKGAQEGLSTPLGVASQIGTGLAGLGVGSKFTGIPTSAGGAWEAGLFGGGGGGTADTAVAGGTAGTAAGETAGAAPATATAGTAAAGGTAAAKGMTISEKIALGLMGVSALTGRPQPLNPTLMNAAGPASTASANLIDQFNSGRLNPTDQYNIAKWAQDSKSAKQQYYAQAGLSNSSMAQQDIAQIDAQAQAMRDQALNNYLNEASTAAGISNPLLANAVNLQIQQDQQAQQAQQQFFQTLAYVTAVGAKA